ncbi:MAG: Rieske 2Fe-2S domain-containing protein [Gammaproteobacteria bacterium]|nr:Rieske 2Fe-2S domain-containing protein [Gammaproteobacteria bacterium]
MTKEKYSTLSTIPFISEKFYEKEKSIWKNSWLMATRESELAEPGSFVTLDIKGIHTSVAILRNGQGELRAYHNNCPHRNGRLFCDRSGKKAAIVCRFHGWAFNLNGQCQAIPEPQLFPGLDKNTISLAAISVDSWGGFVFINLQQNPASSLSDYLQGLPEGLDAFLGDRRWEWHTGYQKEFAANWKDLMNIQHEGYHASHVHKNTLGATFTPEESHNYFYDDSPGVCSRLTVLRPKAENMASLQMSLIQELSMKYGSTSNWVDQDTSRAADESKNAVNLDASDRFVFDCYTFFPNFILFVGTDVLSVMRVWPTGTHSADWEWDWFFKDEMENFGNLFNREHGRMATRNALAEDWPVVEWAHENMRSGAFDKNFVAADMEATVLAHYQKLLQHLEINEAELAQDYE